MAAGTRVLFIYARSAAVIHKTYMLHIKHAQVHLILAAPEGCWVLLDEERSTPMDSEARQDFHTGSLTPVCSHLLALTPLAFRSDTK